VAAAALILSGFCASHLSDTQADLSNQPHNRLIRPLFTSFMLLVCCAPWALAQDTNAYRYLRLGPPACDEELQIEASYLLSVVGDGVDQDSVD
jgi:hypothetical protein